MPHQRLKPENFLDEERLVALKNITPEAFADNKINWSTLKDALGGELEDEEKPDEHFGLFWPGKREARKLASRPSKGTLIPVKGEGIKEETTRNIFIEGENLEVLKILRKSYAGRIKMIYIDPPYNTGNDFVYDDDFIEPLNDYLKRTGQIDGEGRPLTTNKKADGRFHSKWLSMMYPRLRLARELLRDDGVIFVSIDDNEVHHLRMMMNEIFGEENLVAELVWKKKTGAGSSIAHTFDEHEYVLSYSKNKEIMPFWRIKNEYDGNFRNPDNDPRGNWESCAFTAPSKNLNPNQLYQIEVYYDQPTFDAPMIDADSRMIFDKFTYLNHTVVLRNVIENDNSEYTFYDEKYKIAKFIRRWAYAKQNAKNIFDQKRVYFNSGNIPRYKKFEMEYDGKALRSIYFDDFSTQQGTDALRTLFGISVVEYPKPVDLIRHLIQGACNSTEPALILDFFAGSATTAHSVLDLNREDGGNRKFILVQMPEETDEKSEAFKAGYKNIAEIGKERIRRVIKKIESKRKEELPGLSDENGEMDLGFKVFKLTSSNYKPWENYHGESIEKVEELFEEYQVPLVAKWKEVEDGLFTEILLLEGFPLDSIVTEKSEYTKNQIRQVKCSFHENRLLVCLEDKLASETIQSLELADGDTFVCLDTAIDDQAKSRLADKGMIKTI